MEAGRTVSRFGFGRRLLLAATAVAWSLSGRPSEAQQGKTLKWGANREIASLDPYSFGETFTLSVLNHVYEGLVRYTGDLKIEPPRWRNPGKPFHPRCGASSCARASSSTTATLSLQMMSPTCTKCAGVGFASTTTCTAE